MIRKMMANDYEQLTELVYQVHELHYKNRPDIYVDGNSLPLEYFNNMLNDETAFNYVYEENGKILGLIMATKNNNRALPIIKQREIYFIEDIVVDKNYRRKGIGKKLYLFLKERAQEEKVNAIELNVWAFNESAIKFYESLGMSIKNMRLEQLLSDDVIKTKNIEIIVTKEVNK